MIHPNVTATDAADGGDLFAILPPTRGRSTPRRSRNEQFMKPNRTNRYAFGFREASTSFLSYTRPGIIEPIYPAI